MQVIIANRDIEKLISQIQEYVDKGGIIKSIYVVDKTDDDIILLVHDKNITKEMADIWWDGWNSAMSGQIG